jgi:hypothetical protein
MRSRRIELGPRDWRKICEAAIKEDHDSCISSMYRMSHKEREELTCCAARARAFKCMKDLVHWMEFSGHRSKHLRVTLAAAQGGCCKCLELALENVDFERRNDPRIPDAAVESGDAACVRMLHAKGFQFSAYHTTAAAVRGDVSVLKCLHEDVGVDLAEDAAFEASWRGHFDCYDYCFPENSRLCSFPFHEVLEHFSGIEPSLPHVQQLLETFPRAIVTDKVLCEAARWGHLEILKCLYRRSPVNRESRAVDEAASGGHLECLQFLCEQGYTCDDALWTIKLGNLPGLDIVYKYCTPEARKAYDDDEEADNMYWSPREAEDDDEWYEDEDCYAVDDGQEVHPMVAANADAEDKEEHSAENPAMAAIEDHWAAAHTEDQDDGVWDF